MLGTLARPSRGRLELWGLDAVRQRERLRCRLGYIGHEPGHAPLLTALENLQFFCTLHGLERDRALETLDLVGLEGAAGRRAADLSRGMRQRLALGRALLPDPELLVLDEPEAGLDAPGRALLGRILKGRTVVIASHDWPLCRRLCDRALLLRGGRDGGDPFGLEVVAGAEA
jgi:ABC-type multidrug transport system ATPase subunit